MTPPLERLVPPGNGDGKHDNATGRADGDEDPAVGEQRRRVSHASGGHIASASKCNCAADLEAKHTIDRTSAFVILKFVISLHSDRDFIARPAEVGQANGDGGS
jgi:hypothetical protein